MIRCYVAWALGALRIKKGIGQIRKWIDDGAPNDAPNIRMYLWALKEMGYPKADGLLSEFRDSAVGLESLSELRAISRQHMEKELALRTLARIMTIERVSLVWRSMASLIEVLCNSIPTEVDH